MKELKIRNAIIDEVTSIRKIIYNSARILQIQFYDSKKIEKALELITGIEDLISDGTLLVAEYQDKIVACGGWKIDRINLNSGEIRSFFVDPKFIRKGIATLLLSACEIECKNIGINYLYLSATLTGEPFYKKNGFIEKNRFSEKLSNSDTFELVRMEKRI